MAFPRYCIGVMDSFWKKPNSKNRQQIKNCWLFLYYLSLSSSYVADFMVAAGCETFVDKYGKVIIKEGLTRNFLIHLNNLLEFQVISQTHIVSAMGKLTKLKAELNEEQNVKIGIIPFMVNIIPYMGKLLSLMLKISPNKV